MEMKNRASVTRTSDITVPCGTLKNFLYQIFIHLTHILFNYDVRWLVFHVLKWKQSLKSRVLEELNTEVCSNADIVPGQSKNSFFLALQSSQKKLISREM